MTTDLQAAAKRYRAARARMDAAADDLAAAVRKATADGMRQVDILRAIDHVWTREYLRKLNRDLPWQETP